MRIVIATTLSLLVQLLLCVGCYRQEPKSVIVEKAEKAGAGVLLTASSSSMQRWLGEHREVAMEIENMCKPVRKAATAEWGSDTEGRLCAASNELAFFRSAPAKGDGRVFRPGAN